MHRRNFFAVAAGALATSCVPEIAPAKVSGLPLNYGGPYPFDNSTYEDYVARKNGWAEGYDRIDRIAVLEPEPPGQKPGMRFGYFQDKWKTPHGYVVVCCSCSLSYADELQTVKWSHESLKPGRIV